MSGDALPLRVLKNLSDGVQRKGVSLERNGNPAIEKRRTTLKDSRGNLEWIQRKRNPTSFQILGGK